MHCSYGTQLIKLPLTSYTAVISGGEVVLQTTHGCGLGRHGSPLHSVKFRLALISSMASTADSQSMFLPSGWSIVTNFGKTTYTWASGLQIYIKLMADNDHVTGIQQVHLAQRTINVYILYKTELNIKLKESQMQMMKS